MLNTDGVPLGTTLHITLPSTDPSPEIADFLLLEKVLVKICDTRWFAGDFSRMLAHAVLLDVGKLRNEFLDDVGLSHPLDHAQCKPILRNERKRTAAYTAAAVDTLTAGGFNWEVQQ